MNFEELGQLIAEEAGVSICAVCGLPFHPEKSTQKTCASPECKAEWKRMYQRQYRRNMPREKQNEYKKRYRHKLRDEEKREKALDAWAERWENVEASYNRISGDDYGKRQMEKTLAMVPKIDVNLGGGQKNEQSIQEQAGVCGESEDGS